jgi:hypothetical protein
MLLLVLLPPQILLIYGEVGFLWGWKIGGARPADVNFPIRPAIPESVMHLDSFCYWEKPEYDLIY